jgi:hypothetical protein
VTGVVKTPRRLAAVALGPLIAPGSHFLELLVIVQFWIFTTLRLPDVVRWAISTPGLSVGEVVLVEQSRPELIWPMDIILGAGGNAVLSGRWRAFALCRCSGYQGIPVHLLLGPFNGLASAQGWNDDRSPAEKTLMRRRLMRRTMAKTAKDQKTSSRVVSREERDHVHISSARFHAEQ